MAAKSAIDSKSDELKQLSEEIWKHPELKFEEHTAHRLLTDYLEKNGFTVERGYCSMPTAFKATSVKLINILHIYL